MGTTPARRRPEDGDEVTYEVRTGGGLVTLALRVNGREAVFSTDRSSAVTMASDLLRAVRHSYAREGAAHDVDPTAPIRGGGGPRRRAAGDRPHPGRR